MWGPRTYSALSDHQFNFLVLFIPNLTKGGYGSDDWRVHLGLDIMKMLQQEEEPAFLSLMLPYVTDESERIEDFPELAGSFGLTEMTEPKFYLFVPQYSGLLEYEEVLDEPGLHSTEGLLAWASAKVAFYEMIGLEDYLQA